MEINWRPIDTIPTDCTVIALGDQELALVWFSLECGMRWKIMNIPGRGVRLCDRIGLYFHSWCYAGALHEVLNRECNPKYYGLPAGEKDAS